MSSRPTEERDFGQYLADLARARDLPAVQDQERAEVERAARSVLDAALAAERDARDGVAATRKALEDTGSRISRLVARSGATAGVTAPVAPPERLADYPRAVTSLEADLRAAESAWSWVERARQAQPPAAPRTNQPAAAPPPAADPVDAAVKRGGCGPLALAVFANVGLLALLLVMFSG